MSNEQITIGAPQVGALPALILWSGFSLVAGGVLTVALNVVFTPQLQAGAPLAETAASSVFLWRQSSSAATAGLLLFGCVGLLLVQAHRLPWWGLGAFILAFAGSALLLAWEWADVFVLRPLAFTAPEALQKLESGTGLDPYDFGALIPLSAFVLGWLLYAAVTLHAQVLRRAPAWLLIAGFLLTPIFSAAVGLWGAALGNVILGSAWVWLGLEVLRLSAPAVAKPR